MKKWKLLIALWCLPGCKSKPDTDKPSAVVASAQPSSAAPAASAPASSAAVEAEARAFVARWEAAQNSGDFGTYSALYAAPFMGVKRVGQYSKRFDRAGWLADRKPMLAAGAQIKVSDLQLSPSGGSTRAIFTQEFTSKTFKDTGKKELFLVNAPAGFTISREEMLSSDVGASGAGDESVLAFQRDGVVVQRGFEKTKLRGKPRLLSAPGAYSHEITFAVQPDEVSPGARAWLGKEATAYAKDGKTCTGKVARFEVRVDATPPFGMSEAWSGQTDAPKASPAQVATEIAATAQSQEHFVVAVLDKPCSGTWATAAPEPFVKPQAATGALRKAGIAAFKALPAYAEEQRQFEELMKSKSAWESVDGELNVVELRAAQGPRLLVVTARGGVGCGGFTGSLSAFWQVEGSAEAPKLAAIGTTLPRYLALHGALDEGAAGLALLAGPYDLENAISVVRPAAGKRAERVLHSISFWACGC